MKRWRAQSIKKAEQVGAPKGEMPGEAALKTLRFTKVGGREVFGFEERKGKEMGETTFS